MKLTSNAVSIILATLVLGAGAYWYFFTGTGNQTPLAVSAGGNQAQTQFQTLVSELKPITFNTEVFSDPRFNALVDLATPVTPESAGRLDPFASVTGINKK